MGGLLAAHLPLGHLVDDHIELLDGLRGKGVRNAQVPLQVEQVAVPVAHDSPPSDVRRNYHRVKRSWLASGGRERLVVSAASRWYGSCLRRVPCRLHRPHARL